MTKTKLIKTASGMEVRIWEGEEPKRHRSMSHLTLLEHSEIVDKYLSSYKSYPVRSEDEEGFEKLATDVWFDKNGLCNDKRRTETFGFGLSQGIEIPSGRVELICKFCKMTPEKHKTHVGCQRYADPIYFATLLTEDKEGEGQEIDNLLTFHNWMKDGEFAQGQKGWGSWIKRIPHELTKQQLFTLFKNETTKP